MKKMILIIVLFSTIMVNAKIINSDFLSLKNRLFISTLSYSYIQEKSNSYIHIDMKFKSPIYANSGGISFSFPELKKKEYIKNIEYYGFDKLNILPRHSKVWHKKRHKNISSSYLLIEGWNSSKWNKTVVKSISFDIDCTKLNIKQFLTLQFRITLLKGKKKFYFPLEVNKVKDQQGFSIQKIHLNKFPRKSKHD